MSITRRILFGAAANWFSRLATIVMGLVLLPVLFRNLPKEELGVWMLLGQSWAALGILDLGFGATLARRIAFAKGKSGSDPNAPLTDETLGEIAALGATGRRIYAVLSVWAFCVAFGLGFFYLRSLELNDIDFHRVWLAWGVLCVSQALGVWATPWTCLLQGVGYVGWDSILSSCMNALTLLVQIVAALLGGGLVTLAMVAAIGALLQRFLLFGFARYKRPELFVQQASYQPAILREMAPLALRAWLTTFGLFLVLNTDQFFIAGMEGAENIPAYRAAYVILLNINVLAVTVGGASAVFISHLWQSEDLRQIQTIVTRNLRICLSVMACGSACVIGLGQALFDVWLGAGNFVGYPLLCTFSLLLFLEAQSFVISTSSRATEHEVFAHWALGAGVLKIVLSYAFGVRFGLLGIALGTLVAQLATNHWYMVWHGLHRLSLSVRDHVTTVLIPVFCLFIGCHIMVSGVYSLLAQWSSAVGVLGGISASAFVLVGACWLWVLNESQRRRLIGRLQLANR
jgi:O-antigen/teichoic acid export membrane protein